MQSFSKTMAAGLILLGAGLLETSCVDNMSSVFIYGVMDLNSTQCLAQPTTTSVLLASGILDRTFSSGYQAALLVGNQITQRGSREKLRTETSRVQVTGAHITLYGTTGYTTSFDAAATGLINPATGTDPGLAAVFARIVPEQEFANLGPDGQMIARIKILGTTLGGRDLESGEFDFPISICTGCLVTYPSSAIDPATGLCDTASDTMTATNICFFGQDAPFPCTICAATSDVCANPKNNEFYFPPMP